LSKLKLLPRFSGSFDIDFKTCVIVFDGELSRQAISWLRPYKIINMSSVNLKDFYKDDSDIKKIEDSFLTCFQKHQMIELLDKERKKYNIIIYTEEMKNIEFLITSDIYKCRFAEEEKTGVAIATYLNKDWDIKEWDNCIQNILYPAQLDKVKELKCCPLCGNEKILEKEKEKNVGFIIMCKECGCNIGSKLDKEDVRNKWNKRISL